MKRDQSKPRPLFFDLINVDFGDMATWHSRVKPSPLRHRACDVTGISKMADG